MQQWLSRGRAVVLAWAAHAAKRELIVKSRNVVATPPACCAVPSSPPCNTHRRSRNASRAARAGHEHCTYQLYAAAFVLPYIELKRLMGALMQTLSQPLPKPRML